MSRSINDILKNNEKSLKRAREAAEEKLRVQREERETAAVLEAQELLDNQKQYAIGELRRLRKEERALVKQIKAFDSGLSDLKAVKSASTSVYFSVKRSLERGGIKV